MIEKNIEKALNRQIALEGHASSYYLAMASWCDKSGFDGAASFLYQQSDEERQHMLKLVHFMNGLGGFALSPEIKDIPHAFESLKVVFESILNHELEVSKEINELADVCLKHKDYSTFNFLQWYIQEQQEEEHLFASIVDKFEMLGESGQALFMIDRFLAGLAGGASVDTADPIQ